MYIINFALTTNVIFYFSYIYYLNINLILDIIPVCISFIVKVVINKV